MADVIDHANIHFEPSWRPKVGGQKPINAQNEDCFLFDLGSVRKMMERSSTTCFEGFWMVNSVGYVKNRSDLFKNPFMYLLFLKTYPIIIIIYWAITFVQYDNVHTPFRPSTEYVCCIFECKTTTVILDPDALFSHSLWSTRSVIYLITY